MMKAFCGQKCLEEQVYWNLRQKELVLPKFLGQSPQLSQRRYLVDWLSIVWEKHNICPAARQLSIMLLDFFMDMFDIEAKKLHLVALGSFLIATKFEEQDVAIPRVCDLRRDLPSLKYHGKDFIQMELLLLDFYGWNISFPTAAHFTEYYLKYSIDSRDKVQGKFLPFPNSMKQHLEKYLGYFLEISMQEHYYREFLPSHVAAACVASSRICLCIEPSWDDRLTNVTSYSYDLLKPLIDTLLRTHGQDELLQSNIPTPPTTPEQKLAFGSESNTHSTPVRKQAIVFHANTPCTPSNGYV